MVVTSCLLHAMASLTEGQVRRKPLVVILGPTAVGKSRVAIEIAKRLNSEILTADSRQVYRGMDVGTDKPLAAARQGIVHHLIDLIDPDQAFNAGLFRQHATQLIEALHQRRRLPLVVVARASMSGSSYRGCAKRHRAIRKFGRSSARKPVNKGTSICMHAWHRLIRSPRQDCILVIPRKSS